MTFVLFDSNEYLKKSKIDFSRLTIDEFDAFTTLFYDFIYWSQHFDDKNHKNHPCYEADAFFIGELKVNRISRDFYIRIEYDKSQEYKDPEVFTLVQLCLEILYNAFVEDDEEKRIETINHFYKDKKWPFKEDLQTLKAITYELYQQDLEAYELYHRILKGKEYDSLLSRIFCDFQKSNVPLW